MSSWCWKTHNPSLHQTRCGSRRSAPAARRHPNGLFPRPLRCCVVLLSLCWALPTTLYCWEGAYNASRGESPDWGFVALLVILGPVPWAFAIGYFFGMRSVSPWEARSPSRRRCSGSSRQPCSSCGSLSLRPSSDPCLSADLRQLGSTGVRRPPATLVSTDQPIGVLPLRRPSNGDNVESGIESAKVIGIGGDHAQSALAGEDDD